MSPDRRPPPFPAGPACAAAAAASVRPRRARSRGLPAALLCAVALAACSEDVAAPWRSWVFVQTFTSGEGTAPTYTVAVNGLEHTESIAATGHVWISLDPGRHMLELTDVPSHCLLVEPADPGPGDVGHPAIVELTASDVELINWYIECVPSHEN